MISHSNLAPPSKTEEYPFPCAENRNNTIGLYFYFESRSKKFRQLLSILKEWKSPYIFFYQTFVFFLSLSTNRWNARRGFIAFKKFPRYLNRYLTSCRIKMKPVKNNRACLVHVYENHSRNSGFWNFRPLRDKYFSRLEKGVVAAQTSFRQIHLCQTEFRSASRINS